VALALYRKYRPRTFAEVIGQEHVTEPLTQALRSGRLHHAYLFSGPRGCGKTSSARILARSLNCEQGPTPEPCGTCVSCRSLTNDGTGSIDVIEIDAASHGGVDDARDLREKAFFAPAASRYKIYVIDEAHMVSSAGFNALLKLVEEPPDYVKFIFATTEPEKVLGTIKSRTHHYPFRLIPPVVLRPYLQQLADAEGIGVEPAVFPLVVRAGGGSVRDTLSVLDQLIAGAGPEGVTYPRAVALLGVTDVTLIDDMCDAVAAGDGATAYTTIDRVVEAGHDPRRFASDLLERFRDLIVLQQVPDAVAKGLIDGPADQLDAMSAQATRLGPATLSRCADIVHNGLVEMRGTTAPRLLLELITARMLLPGADDSAGALLQRLERMERRLTLSGDAADLERSELIPNAVGGVAAARAVAAAAAVSPATGQFGADGGSDVTGGAGQVADASAAPVTSAAPEGSASGSSSSSGRSAAGSRSPAGLPGSAESAGSDASGGLAGSGGSSAAASGPAPAGSGAPASEPPAASEVPSDAGGRSWPAPQARRPEPAGVLPDAPDDSAAASSGTGLGQLTAASIREVWPEIITAVGRQSKKLAALASGATVRDLDGQTLVLTFRFPAHARLVAADPDLITNALYEAVGGRWEIRCEVAGEAGAVQVAPGQAQRNAPTQKKAPAGGRSAPVSSPEDGVAVTSARPREAASRHGAGASSTPGGGDGDWPEPATPGGRTASSSDDAEPGAIVHSVAASGGAPPARSDGARAAGSDSARAAGSGSARPAGSGSARPAGSGRAGPAGSGRAGPAGSGSARTGNGPRPAAGTGPAAPGTGADWPDGADAEEPPYDPDYDGPVRGTPVAYDGFDPGDEPLDDVLDEKTARQSSEQQVMQLLQDTLGAEKIGEV
jgi:DNA polymerase-3 subunit gamma/tau